MRCNNEGATHHHACECREAKFRELEKERDRYKEALFVCEGYFRAGQLLNDHGADEMLEIVKEALEGKKEG